MLWLIFAKGLLMAWRTKIDVQGDCKLCQLKDLKDRKCIKVVWNIQKSSKFISEIQRLGQDHQHWVMAS
jgi:hypothetical protein